MTAEEYYEKGRVLYEARRYEEAMDCFDCAIALDENYSLSWYGKGSVYKKYKSYDEALSCFEKAIALDENFEYAWNEKGNIYIELKSYEQALVYFDKAIALDENLALPWNGKGKAYFELKFYEQALVCLDKAISLDGNFAKPWYGKGSVYYELKSYEQALVCLDKAIALDESYVHSWHEKGNVYSALKSYEQALACFDKAIALDEHFAYSWNGKGNIYYELESYEEAMVCYNRAIELDDNFAYPWYGKGNVYSELKSYKQALTSYDHAITRDENFVYPWYGKGNAYYALKIYDEALDCYDQAIALDEKFSYPWNGKGVIHQELKTYELSKKNYIRAFYLEESPVIIHNNLQLFKEYPTAPFYVYHLIRYLDPERYSENKNLIEYAFEQCQYLHAYIGWLQLSGKDKAVKPWEWQEGIALINYFMADPVVSMQTYQEVLKRRPKDLRSWYYLIQSCRDFFEPEEKYLNDALAVAESYRPVAQKWYQGKEKLSNYDLQQRYYAGLLFYLNDEPAKALAFFQSIEAAYLPAAYLSYFIQNERPNKKSEKLLVQILKREQLLESSKQGFGAGIPVQALDLDREDFWAPFYRYAHYIECLEAIKMVYFSTELRKVKEKTGLRYVSPLNAKNFWDAWTLSRESWQRIFQHAREYHLKGLTEEIFRSRSQALKKEAKKVKVSSEETEEHIRQQQSERLLDAYEKLKQESTLERREQRLGNMITEWTLAKPEPYHTLTSVFLIEGGLTEKQKVFLDFYIRIQHYSRQKPSDILFAGLKDDFKEIIGKGIDLLATAADFSGALLTLLLKPFIKGTLSELIIKYLKSGAPPFKTYEGFKKGFELFLGEEKDRLGEQFEKRYPMWGLEEWLE